MNPGPGEIQIHDSERARDSCRIQGFIRIPAARTPSASAHSHCSLPREQAVGQWVVVDGQAARPKDLYILRGAGAQFVGRAGGEDGAVFDSPGGLFANPLRARRCLAILGGGWGLTRTLDRRIVSHIVCTQMFI